MITSTPSKLRALRNRKKRCPNCGRLISKTSKTCKYCMESTETDPTLGELRAKGEGASVYGLVRKRARALCEGRDVCERCGYSRYVEVCHIKPIAAYPNEARVSEVNQLHNLVVLCPNCHWELDHPIGL